MKIVVFGANGMVGGAVLRECLEEPRIESVLAVGRRSCGLSDPKLTEILHSDLFDLRPIASELTGYDACFYCIGVTSAGRSEAEYSRITHDLTVAILQVVTAVSPAIVIGFVSGQGADGSERGRVMWARVKGRAENHVLGLPQKSFVFRPGVIQPMKGVRSGTRIYQTLYTLSAPITPLLKRLLPGMVTTSVHVGRAMIRIAFEGHAKRILETRDINEAGEGPLA